MKRILIFSGALLCAQASHAALTAYGKGNISDTINTSGYGCVVDHGNWIYNAGVVKPGVSSCNPIGTPTKLYPQSVALASDGPTPSHRWWGSVPFLGEMKIGNSADAAYITPDPIVARITDRGVRMMGIPSGLATTENSFTYAVPDPFSEVFDGIAIGNSAYSNLEAALKDYSDGSATVQWRSGSTPVMEATFVYGSPYVYFKVLAGQPVIRTKAGNGPEKSIFFQQGEALGVHTNVAGNSNHFLIVGQGGTAFANVESAAIGINTSSNAFTVALLPLAEGSTPSASLIGDIRRYAQTPVAKVRVDYAVDPDSYAVKVTHRYLQANGAAAQTLAGLMPLQWKHSSQSLSPYKVRSARGVVRFAPTSEFSYELPFVGVLPYFPENVGDYDAAQLRRLVDEFVNQGSARWNDKTDTYWAGKNYGKVAELAAIARSNGLTQQADQLLNWLKAELQDWFTANTTGALDRNKYFVYDKDWNTLLGFDESFGAQQQLNDHHFHYGYFVRAAAEICRVDPSWCGANAYGPMVELLIRDYAGGRNDSLFPYLRNFDPANGFSWASGHANFVLGNNNESTSEAANAYGAMVLYGLITQNQNILKRGVYLHASTTAAYWEYWNNISRYEGMTGDHDNFPSAYDKMTTSIIWGTGAVFSTWFSGANAHILGIQGLPLSPLVLHIGQHADYLEDYVRLGLSGSSNQRPSGLPEDQWRDVWWNIWAMTDGEAAVSDFRTMNFNYNPEAGETKAHTYHWIHTLKQLGHLATGTGTLTANHPAAVAFDKQGVRTYLAYNFSAAPIQVRYSDGMQLNVPAGGFRIKNSNDPSDPTDPGTGDRQAPSTPRALTINGISATVASASWQASTDNVGVAGYNVSLSGGAGSVSVTGTSASLTGLQPATAYQLSVQAYDQAGNTSSVAQVPFTTSKQVDTQAPTKPGTLSFSELKTNSARISWAASTDNVGVARYEVKYGAATVNATANSAALAGLIPNTRYDISVVAIDSAGNRSAASTGSFSTPNDVVEPPSCSSEICFQELNGTTLRTRVKTTGFADIHYKVNNGGQMNVRMTDVGDYVQYDISGLKQGDVVDVFFTIIDGTGRDTPWMKHSFGGGNTGGDNDAAPVSVYQHSNFGGYRVALVEGSYKLADLLARGMKNDDITSGRVAQGWVVELYEHDSFQGQKSIQTADFAGLPASFNDRTTSIVVRKAAAFADGTYRIKAKHSGKCVDVSGGSADDYAAAIQWTCHTGNNQRWIFTALGNGYHWITAKHSGKCLDVLAGSAENGARLVQFGCHAGTNQQWKVERLSDGSFRLIARHSGRVMDVSGVSVNDGAPLHQWSYVGGANQQFLLERVE